MRPAGIFFQEYKEYVRYCSFICYVKAFLHSRNAPLFIVYLPFIHFLIYTMSTQITGTVKFFNEEKGFGFIKHDQSGTETFVHANGLIDQIETNDRVVFDVEQGRKGMNAVNVKRVG